MTRMAKPTFQIGRSTGQCAATGQAFAPGDAFVAALIERPDSEELERQDFALEAWESGSRPSSEGGRRVFASWRGVVPSADTKKKVLIDDAALLELFEQLDGQTDSKRQAFRFVLALILIRKRLLICETTRGTTMLVRSKGTPRPAEGEAGGPDLVEVVDPGLDEATIGEVMDQLSAVMAGGPGVVDEPAPSQPAPGTTGEPG